jgi:glycine oxidase
VSESNVIVVGAGVAGLAAAFELAERGLKVEVVDRGSALGDRSCSWMAGGMLAPWCERASTDASVADLGAEAISWWMKNFIGTVQSGSLVVAAPRDLPELTHFAERTERYEWIDGDRVNALEPDLAGRFRKALFFPDEAHLDPRRALPALADLLKFRGVQVRFGVDFHPAQQRGTQIVDCRGLAARDVLKDLRGVRGEMLIVRSSDITLSRPVRVLHPRIPLYIVPRGGGVFMIGATMIESESRAGASVRSTLELLGAACALHPAFGEAEILEINADLRPAFTTNLPAIRRIGSRTHFVNGLFRHGFLLAPMMARQVADAVVQQVQSQNQGASDAGFRKRRSKGH